MMIWVQDLIIVIGETGSEEGLAFGLWIKKSRSQKWCQFSI